MKKLAAFCFTLFFCATLAVPSHAQAASVGEVIGNIYATDIVATINGVPITSYSLHGRTAIVVEDLAFFGFSVMYHDRTRVLNVNTLPEVSDIRARFMNNPHRWVQEMPAPIYTVIGNIYHTDIETIIDGIPVASFAIGGRMSVIIEHLGQLIPNMSYDWDPVHRVIALNVTPPLPQPPPAILHVQFSDANINAFASPGDGGVVSVWGQFPIGSLVPMRAIPNRGWTFEGWFEDGVLVNQGITWHFTAMRDMNLEARFTQRREQTDTFGRLQRLYTPASPHLRPVPEIMGWSTNGDFGTSYGYFFVDGVLHMPAQYFPGIVTDSFLTSDDFADATRFVIEFRHPIASLEGINITDAVSPGVFLEHKRTNTILNPFLTIDGNRLVYTFPFVVNRDLPFALFFHGIENFEITSVYLEF